MAIQLQPEERRKRERFIMRDGAYAFLRPPANKIGQVIDISLDGLAFSYFSTNGPILDAHGLDLLADEGIYLENLPFKTVNDFIIPNEQPYSQITMRRRCIQFGNLTTRDRNLIQNLIDKYGNHGD